MWRDTKKWFSVVGDQMYQLQMWHRPKCWENKKTIRTGTLPEGNYQQRVQHTFRCSYFRNSITRINFRFKIVFTDSFCFPFLPLSLMFPFLRWNNLLDTPWPTVDACTIFSYIFTKIWRHFMIHPGLNINYAAVVVDFPKLSQRIPGIFRWASVVHIIFIDEPDKWMLHKDSWNRTILDVSTKVENCQNKGGSK